MQDIIDQLETLRRRSRVVLMVQRGALLLACAAAGLMLVIGFDFLLRLPGALRLAIGLLGLGAIGYVLWTYVRPAFAFRPTLIQLALRAEQALPSVAGRLASSVEFAAAGMDRENPLAARSVRDTQTRLQGEHVGRIVRHDGTWRGIGALLAVVAVAVLLGVAFPAAASTGLQRIVMPLGDARWPARTGVESLMSDVVPDTRVHPRGQALALRARVTKGPEAQRIWARVRLHGGAGAGGWQDLVLTHQGDGIHERLVDTDAEHIELSFRTADDRTAVERVRLVPPPAIVRATLEIEPPPFASGRVPAVEQELGTGSDARSVTERPALIGSRVKLSLLLNKHVPVPSGAARDAWIARTLGWDDGAPPRLTAATDEPRWELRWQLEQTRELDVGLEDEFGLQNTDPIRYRIEAVEDRPPAVTVLEPQADEPVLPTATVPLVAEASDDVAVARVGLEARVQRAGDGAPPDEAAWFDTQDVDATTARAEAELDLSGLSLVEGDTVVIEGVALDMFELEGRRHGLQRSAPRRLRVISEIDFATQMRRQLSAVRQNAIRIEGIQGELQDDVIDNGVTVGIDRAQAQVGERIADQREALDEIAEQLERNRLDDEALSDLLRQARDLLDFAGRAASRAVEAIGQRTPPGGEQRPRDPAEAGRAAPENRAARDRGGERAAEVRPGGEAGDADAEAGAEPGDERDADAAADEADPDGGIEVPELREPREADRPVTDAQQEVREELGDLIELLDRDEDTWVVTRQLESLLADQQRLMAETSQLNRRTMGRDRAELSEQDRSDLDRITEQQEDLRDQARQAIDNMRDRVPALEDVDPEAADGMRSAANLAEQRELDREMEAAADRSRENQLQNAMSRQEGAAETLERMLEEIQESKRARAEQLLRRLASLLESIERLINVQELELVAFAGAQANGNFAGRDRAMIRLNQNTQAVATEARAAGQQTQRVARSLDRAADAQGAAVAALRAEPVRDVDANLAEERSLELLKEALALASELQEQTQEEQMRRRREEIVAVYRELAEREVALREQTLRLAQGDELNRRQLVEARRLATEQDAVARGLGDIQSANPELLDAAIFTMVHDRIERWAASASNGLRDGDVGVDVSDPQEWIARAIGRIIEALEEATAPPDEFAGESDDGSGQGQGQGQPGQDQLIPPVTQLRLLQGVQQEIYDRTRSLDQRTDLDPARRRQRLRDVGQQQRDLQELGSELIEQFQNQGGGPGGAPGDDGPRPGFGSHDRARPGEPSGAGLARRAA